MKNSVNRSKKNANVLKAELSVNLCNEIMQSRRVSIIVPDPSEHGKKATVLLDIDAATKRIKEVHYIDNQNELEITDGLIVTGLTQFVNFCCSESGVPRYTINGKQCRIG